MNNKQENFKKGSKFENWVVLCHLSGLVGMFFPLGNVVLPIVIWMYKNENDPEVNKHGISVINFHVSWTIYMIISGLLVFVIVGLPLLLGLLVFGLIVSVKGTLMANEGKLYSYPLSIEFLKEKNNKSVFGD
jgi:uncharacterized Tic20 family protein